MQREPGDSSAARLDQARGGETTGGSADTPRTLGRYVVLYELHRGTAAVVYAAYDPELDRKVAIKLLSAQRSTDPRHRSVSAHLVHPSLVTVHDVGALEDQIFIAMEFVAGGPLSMWLAGQRSARAILQRFLDAGVGLQAAHAQGLAHHGFAADAVLVEEDGRARVLGLYRPASAEDHAAAVQKDVRGFLTALRRALSPGGDAAGGWIAGVPAPVRRLLQRDSPSLQGPGQGPGQGLGPVLRCLRRDPRGRRTGLAAIGVLTVAAGLALYLHQQRQQRLCRGVHTQIAQLFGPDRAQAIRSAFHKTGKPYADDVFAGVQRVLDDYLPRLAALSQTSCEEARQQPEAAHDLRLACLAQQRARLEHLLTLFLSADEQLLQRAVSLLHETADQARLARCGDPAGLRASAPQRDGTTVDAVAALRQDLDRVSTLRRAGRLQESLRLAQQSTTRAQQLPYRPVHAEAIYEEALVHNALGEYPASDALLQKAIWIAEASHGDRVAAQGWLRLFYSAGFQQIRLPEAREHARHAAAALERCTDCADLWSWWHEYMGDLLLREARVKEALTYYQESHAQRLKQLPPTDLTLARSYGNLGMVYGAFGQADAALAAQQQALQITEQQLGPLHPSTATALGGLALVLQDLGRRDESLVAHQRSLRVYEQAYGPSHVEVGCTLSEMGSLLIDMERLPEAQAHLERGLPILQRALGPQSPRVGAALYLLGLVALRRHAYAEALPHFTAALQIREAGLPPDHIERAFSLVGVGRALIGLGRPDEALPLVQRALAVCAVNSDAAQAQAQPDAWFALALVRWHHPATRREALALAHRASAAYAALGDGFETERGEIDAWLRRHRSPR